jgi:hypothetical protein
VTWHAMMAEDDLWEGELTGFEVAGKKLALLNVGGEIRAFEGRCPTSVPDSVSVFILTTPSLARLSRDDHRAARRCRDRRSPW